MKITQIDPLPVVVVVPKKKVNIELTPEEAKNIMNFMFGSRTDAHHHTAFSSTSFDTSTATALYILLDDLGYNS